MRLASDPYPVFAETADFTHLREFLAGRDYASLIVLTDDHTRQHCLPLLQKALGNTGDMLALSLPPGEGSKSLASVGQVCNFLLERAVSRKALFINLGGGMITDLGGFAASVYKRGIDFVHIPTSLLAQVDAAIGGKTGVNAGAHKNMIGTVAMPAAVCIHAGFLKSLPRREYTAGRAEVLKHALIADADYWEQLLRGMDAEEMVKRSVEIKTSIILQDPLEKGERKKLNFGHTIGHALESWYLQPGHEPILHGEAVAAGMLAESYLSHLLLGLSKPALDRIVQTISSSFPRLFFSAADIPGLIGFMRNDKKNAGAALQFALLRDIGASKVDIAVPDNLIIESLEYYLSHA